MSGGSLCYLFCKEPEDLFDESTIYYLEKAEQYLLRNDAVDVAKDVRRLIEYVISAKNRIEVMQENLKEVFKAIEWYESGDSGKDRVERAIAVYRGEGGESQNDIYIKPYEEKDTECDLCEFKHECILIDVTRNEDTRTHMRSAMGNICKKHDPTLAINEVFRHIANNYNLAWSFDVENNTYKFTMMDTGNTPTGGIPGKARTEILSVAETFGINVDFV